MIPFLCVLAGLLGLYLLTLRGRAGHKGLQQLQGWSYAHRGLHGNGLPENSLAAFRAAVDAGYGCELDVHLMKDGNLAVIHDHSLKRTAGVDVRIEDLTLADLENYRLEGTDEKIPTLPQVLALFAGKVPLIVELKEYKSNHQALTAGAVQALSRYEGVYCIESFSPHCIHDLKKKYPHIIRGQLATNFMKARHMPLPVRVMMTCLLTSFLTRPDFIAYDFDHRKNLSVFLSRKLWGIQGVSWTLRSQEAYDAAVKEGYLPIFENFLP